jgi:hypothetical protein
MLRSTVLIFLSISILALGGTDLHGASKPPSQPSDLINLLHTFETNPFVEACATPSFDLALPEGQVRWKRGKIQRRFFVHESDTLHHLLLSGKGKLILEPRDSLNTAALEGFLGKAPFEKTVRTLHLFVSQVPVIMEDWPFERVKTGKIKGFIKRRKLKGALKAVKSLQPGHPLLEWATWQSVHNPSPFALLVMEPGGMRLRVVSDELQSILKPLFDGSSVLAPIQSARASIDQPTLQQQISQLLAHASNPSASDASHSSGIRSIHHSFKHLPTGAVDFESIFELQGPAPFLFLLLDSAIELEQLPPNCLRSKHSPWLFVQATGGSSSLQLRGHSPSHAVGFGRAWLPHPSLPTSSVPTIFAMEPSQKATLYLPPSSFLSEATPSPETRPSVHPGSTDSIMVISSTPAELPWLDIRPTRDLHPQLKLIRSSGKAVQTASSKERRNTAEFSYDEELLGADRSFRPPNPMDIYEAGVEPDLLTPPVEAAQAALKLMDDELNSELQNSFLALEKILGNPHGTLLLVEGNPPTSRRAQQLGLANKPFGSNFPAIISSTTLQQASPWARLHRTEVLARQWSPLDADVRRGVPRWFLLGIARTAALIALETQGVNTRQLRDEALNRETKHFIPKRSSTQALLGERAGGQWMSDPIQSQLAWRFCFLLENLRWRLHAADAQPTAFLHCLRLENFNPDLEKEGLELWFEHQLKPLLAALSPRDPDEELLNFVCLLGLTKPPKLLVSLGKLEGPTGARVVRIRRVGCPDGLLLSVPVLIESDGAREWKLLESSGADEFFPLDSKDIQAWQIAPQGNPWVRIIQE